MGINKRLDEAALRNEELAERLRSASRLSEVMRVVEDLGLAAAKIALTAYLQNREP